MNLKKVKQNKQLKNTKKNADAQNLNFYTEHLGPSHRVRESHKLNTQKAKADFTPVSSKVPVVDPSHYQKLVNRSLRHLKRSPRCLI